MSQDPLLTIRCLVYNHEPYLRQCLDGFVMQQTNFPFEAIVHDDASTDGSAAIIREYAEKYPDIIKPIYETENQYSKHDGSLRRIMDAAMHPNSKYVASCEGDDYWTDPHKLQLQVDFLEAHPDYYMTCHAYTYYYEESKEFVPHKFISGCALETFNGREFCTPTIDNYFVFSEWFTQMLSIVRRNQVYVEEEKKSQYKPFFDYIACYYMMKFGKCAVFKDVMGVYRRQDGGVYTGTDSVGWKERCLKNFYLLHRMEHEDRAVRLIEEYMIYVVNENLRRGNYLRALSDIVGFIKGMSLSHFLKLMWLSFKSHFVH